MKRTHAHLNSQTPANPPIHLLTHTEFDCVSIVAGHMSSKVHCPRNESLIMRQTCIKKACSFTFLHDRPQYVNVTPCSEAQTFYNIMYKPQK